MSASQLGKQVSTFKRRYKIHEVIKGVNFNIHFYATFARAKYLLYLVYLTK